MVKGFRAYNEKDRRRVRRQNHVARDLRTDKYKIRRVESKKDRGEKYPIDWNSEDEE